MGILQASLLGSQSLRVLGDLEFVASPLASDDERWDHAIVAAQVPKTSPRIRR
jgi:hypothetical protein